MLCVTDAKMCQFTEVNEGTLGAVPSVFCCSASLLLTTRCPCSHPCPHRCAGRPARRWAIYVLLRCVPPAHVALPLLLPPPLLLLYPCFNFCPHRCAGRAARGWARCSTLLGVLPALHIILVLLSVSRKPGALGELPGAGPDVFCCCLCCCQIMLFLYRFAQVRWASCQALGQMCTDLGPELQTKCGGAVLPALLAAMDDFANPRVQVGCSNIFLKTAEAGDGGILVWRHHRCPANLGCRRCSRFQGRRAGISDQFAA